MVQLVSALLVVGCLLLSVSGQGDDYFKGEQYNRKKSQNLPVNNQAITKGVISFSWDLFKQVANNQNVAISPLAPQLLLAYLNLAADGRTKQEISTAIKNLTPEDMDWKLKNILGKANSKNSLSIKSALFLDNQVTLNDDFENRAAGLDIGTFKVDMDVPSAAIKTINDWIARTTKGLIKQAVSPQLDTRGTRLMMVNALAFDGKWRVPFNPSGQGLFEIAPGKTRQVVYMNKVEKMYGGVTNLDNVYRAIWVEIPYDHGEYSMYIFLPNERHNIQHMVHHMSLECLQNIVFGEKTTAKFEFNLTMPRFVFESTISMKAPLAELGVRDLFTGNSNLPYLSKVGSLQVDDMMQTVRMEVDEEGTKAAAATVVNVITLSYASEPQKFDLLVDQPFLAMVIDNKNKVPLFMAKIDRPLL